MEKKELEEKLRELVIFTEGDGQGQATNTTLEEELGEYAMQKVLDLFSQELDKAREEVLLELLEKKTNYKIEEVDHGYKVTQEYVLVSDIEKELSKLKSKK